MQVFQRRANGDRRTGNMAGPSSARYLRTVNYLAGARIYLRDNVLLREPLKSGHVKDRLLGR